MIAATPGLIYHGDETQMADLYVCLSEADQKRYECGPRLSVVLLDITAREQACLQVAFGYHTPEEILQAMKAMFPPEGDEETKAQRDSSAMLTLAWLALRQNGSLKARRGEDITAELGEFDIQLIRAYLDFDSPDSEGKDESADSTETKTSTT